jgi:hypothetical protein
LLCCAHLLKNADGEKIRGVGRVERARYYYLYHFTVSRVKWDDCYFPKKLHSARREEKEIFGANNRDIVSVHQNGCKTWVLPRSIGGHLETDEREALQVMATYRDPVRCFAPLEVIERLLEIRAEAGYSPALYLLSPDDLAAYLDAYGFDVYAFSDTEAEFHFGDYRAPLAPGGDHAHNSLTAH